MRAMPLFERLIAFLVVLAVLFWVAHASEGLPWSLPEASVEADVSERSLDAPIVVEHEDDDEDDEDKEEKPGKERKKKGRGHEKRGRD